MMEMRFMSEKRQSVSDYFYEGTAAHRALKRAPYIALGSFVIVFLFLVIGWY